MALEKMVQHYPAFICIYSGGSQTVAGTNYCFLCRGRAVVPGAKADYELVYVYQDLDGKAKITASRTLVKGTKNFRLNKGNISGLALMRVKKVGKGKYKVASIRNITM